MPENPKQYQIQNIYLCLNIRHDVNVAGGYLCSYRDTSATNKDSLETNSVHSDLTAHNNNQTQQSKSGIILLTYLLIYVSYGAEHFLRSCQLCSHSGTSHHFKEPEGSLPSSQEPSTVRQINPVHTIPSYISKIYFNIVHPPTSWS
jgi:hypothetical protein